MLTEPLAARSVCLIGAPELTRRYAAALGPHGCGTHIVDGAGERVMNIDNLGPLREMSDTAAPPDSRLTCAENSASRDERHHRTSLAG